MIALALQELPKFSRLYWAAIREDLLLHQNRDALAAVRVILRDDERPQARQLATLSTIRPIDTLVWKGRRKDGYAR